MSTRYEYIVMVVDETDADVGEDAALVLEDTSDRAEAVRAFQEVIAAQILLPGTRLELIKRDRIKQTSKLLDEYFGE